MNINESTNYWESHLPFGGRAGTSSGVGGVGGGSVLEAFTEPKTVVLTLDPDSRSRVSSVAVEIFYCPT